MSDFQKCAKTFSTPEEMASNYLKMYFQGREIIYPINPFQMLKDEDIVFSFRPFDKLEGVYLPAENVHDIPVVAINLHRPITRQRFTAAHELCHHFRDYDTQIFCNTYSPHISIEKFADRFAAALLMPISELKKIVDARKHNGYVSFDDVLKIADYFGVSFESCVFRIAYHLHAIEGDCESKKLKRRISEYGPERKRKEHNMNYVTLYEGLMDAYEQIFSFEPTEYARNVFQNVYIYNDSRMEGVDITLTEASEIVTDLRLNKQNSTYCNENPESEPYMSIAGNYAMYQKVLDSAQKQTCSVFDTVPLNKELFSHYPHPEYGGTIRQSNALVMGAKFNTVSYEYIFSELIKIDEEIEEVFKQYHEMNPSTYIKKVFEFHHRLTVIHPFADGNGRTLRAFMNAQLVRKNISPLYIKTEEKDDYFSALEIADTTHNYSPLYEVLFKCLLRSSFELTTTE